MAFVRAECEFLRLAAKWDVQAEALRSLLPRVDLAAATVLSNAHQLYGVLPWRLLSPALAADVPAPRQEQARQRLSEIAAESVSWREETASCISLLESSGSEYVAIGGPSQYSPLGVDTWPRSWTDLDFFVTPDRIAHLQDLATALSATVVAHRPSAAELEMPHGARLQFFTCPPWGMRSVDYFAGASTVQAFGMQYRIPRAEALVAEWAWDVWYRIQLGIALSLWYFARIAAWIQSTPSWSWTVFGDLLKRSIEAQAEEAVATYTYAPDGTETITQYHDPGSAQAQEALWVLTAVNRIYGLWSTPTFAADLIAPHPMVSPLLTVPQTGTKNWLLCQWDSYPGDESLIFDYAPGIRDDEAVGKGMWKVWAPAGH